MDNLILYRIREKRRTKARNRLWSKAENEWRAEIERLRDALREIACTDENCSCVKPFECPIDDCIHGKARAALGEGK